MKKTETLKADINKSLKQTQENTINQVETLREETNPLKIEENAIEQVKEMNRTVQDIKM